MESICANVDNNKSVIDCRPNNTKFMVKFRWEVGNRITIIRLVV